MKKSQMNLINPPAFPHTEVRPNPHSDAMAGCRIPFNGMGMLEWFASQATDKDVDAIMSENIDSANYNYVAHTGPDKPIYTRQAARWEHGIRMMKAFPGGIK